MTKDQYLRHIETVMKSPRSDSQKINCLVSGFEQYVNDVVQKLEGYKYVEDSYLLDWEEAYNEGLEDAIKAIKAGGHHD